MALSTDKFSLVHILGEWLARPSKWKLTGTRSPRSWKRNYLHETGTRAWLLSSLCWWLYESSQQRSHMQWSSSDTGIFATWKSVTSRKLNPDFGSKDTEREEQRPSTISDWRISKKLWADERVRGTGKASVYDEWTLNELYDRSEVPRLSFFFSAPKT